MTPQNLQNLFRDICEIVGADPEIASKDRKQTSRTAKYIYASVSRGYSIAISWAMASEPIGITESSLFGMMEQYNRYYSQDRQFRETANDVREKLKQRGWKIN